MNWGYHIKKLREEKGMTQVELAKSSGLGRSHISRIEAGVYQGYKQNTLERLARGLDITIGELNQEIYGGESIDHQETLEEILDRFRVIMPESVPIYEEYPFHAGAPVEPMDYVPVVKETAKGRNLEAYIACGGCLEPEISDGNIIIIDRDGQIEHGDIVACLVKDELHLARLKKIAGEIYLENNHGRMKLEECQVVAPVIQVRRDLK